MSLLRLPGTTSSSSSSSSSPAQSKQGSHGPGAQRRETFAPAPAAQHHAGDPAVQSAGQPNVQRASSLPFAPHAKAPGEGIPGYRTSFNVAAKGGGAFKPISEDFEVNPASGTLSLTLPITVSPSRGGFEPALKLSYDSGSGNGAFGFGWGVSLPSIHRKTSHQVPTYIDEQDDIVYSGTDIVRSLCDDGTGESRTEHVQGTSYNVTVYRPRLDPSLQRIERWETETDASDVHWRVLSPDNGIQVFGDTDQSRISDHTEQTRRIFSWLLSRSWDAFGNAIEYRYKCDDACGVVDADGCTPPWEQNRDTAARTRQRYIKRILYGNTTPCRDLAKWETIVWPEQWMFEVVFDYGEHSQADPTTVEARDWSLRPDAFSQTTAGFEIRTYRLCTRVLMFHHLPQCSGDMTNVTEALVSSTSLCYNSTPQRTVLTSFTPQGHSSEQDNTGGTSKRTLSMPTWKFQYTQTADPGELELKSANTVELLDLPNSKSKVSEWLDLDGEGMPGLLSRFEDGSLYYQRNMGPGAGTRDESQFVGAVVLAQQPSIKGGSFQDLDRNGHLNYVVRNDQGRLLGYFERGDSDTWSTFSEFPSTPNGDSPRNEPLEVDLTGDGLADRLFLNNDQQGLFWQKNLGKNGFSAEQSIIPSSNLGQRPYKRQDDRDVKTLVVDMSGSGMSDIVEISASSVRYWPNLGHGVIGPVVEMGNPPTLAPQSEFDPARIMLIDVDGSGTTDLIYALPMGGAALYYNLAGNSWSEKVMIPQLPAAIDPTSVFALDILGRGTACLCWADNSIDGHHIRYIDIVGERKPHLLQRYHNGLGAATTVEYSPSTEFYAQDRRIGQPWTTQLAFPVQCVSLVCVEDGITGRQHSTKYVYHNGAYDPSEKQFAGFEMVEEWRDEVLIIGKDESYRPPTVHVKYWFSVGLALDVDASRFITKPRLASTLTPQQHPCTAEVLAALKGQKYRTETYSLDGTPRAEQPLAVEERGYQIEVRQTRGINKYSVVRVNNAETLTNQYERDLQDPRTAHDFVLKLNAFGDIEEKLCVVYPRLAGKDSEFVEVAKNHRSGNMSWTQVCFTEVPLSTTSTCFRKPEAWKQQEFEILNFPFNGQLSSSAAASFRYRDLPQTSSISTWAALRHETRARYRSSSLEDTLPAGKLESFSVLNQTYSLALDPGLTAKLGDSLHDCGVSAVIDDILVQGGYVQLDDHDGWWTPSSRSFFSPREDAQGTQELLAARRSFYVPQIFVDIFGSETTVTMDPFGLLVNKVEDPVGNTTIYGNDYHRLQPVRITDTNSNTTRVVLDPLGNTIGLAILGKGGQGEEDVDSLQKFRHDVPDKDVRGLLEDNTGLAADEILGSAGARTIYCLDRQAFWTTGQDHQNQKTMPAISPRPAFLVHLSRARSSAKNAADVRVEIEYLDGGGAPIQRVSLTDEDDPRRAWLFDGLLICDRQKQNICTYRPWFSGASGYMSAQSAPSSSAISFFDASSRHATSWTPGNIMSKTVYTPWLSIAYGAADMALCSQPRMDVDVGHFFQRISRTATIATTETWHGKRAASLDKQERRAAEQSAMLSDAPVVTHLGVCGLPILTVRKAGGNCYRRRFDYDVSGNKVRDFDSLDRLVEKSRYDKLGHKIWSKGMDSGETGTLPDAFGTAFVSWNSRGFLFTTKLDRARRPAGMSVRRGEAQSSLIIRVTYGESADDAARLNLRNQVWKVEDQAGIHVNQRFSIRGHCQEQTFQPAQEYKAVIDWSLEVPMEKVTYSAESVQDHFGQVIEESDMQGNRTRRRFSRQGRVLRVDFLVAGKSDWKIYLRGVTLTADGLPLSMSYGNGAESRMCYDDDTRLLISQVTTRPKGSSSGKRRKKEVLEDIRYVHDIKGRRVYSCDRSEQSKYFRGQCVAPEQEFTYDSADRLVAATGRAQLSKMSSSENQLAPHGPSSGSRGVAGTEEVRGVADGNSLYQYLETYDYDLEGNIKSMMHTPTGLDGISGWTRTYFYEEASLLSDSPEVKNNRLSRTAIGDKEEGSYTYAGDGGTAGCVTGLPGFTDLQWDMHNLLAMSSTQTVSKGNTAEKTYYVYNHSGQRTRKVTESFAASGSQPRKLKETFLFDSIQLQARGEAGALWIAQVKGESLLASVETSNKLSAPLPRLQVGVGMELDFDAQLISYEEYSPFGSIVFSAVYRQVETSRTYRFARYELDGETGLYHCGLRYYCPWLGRWMSPDPLGDVDGPNLYEYINNDPVNGLDPSGTSKRGLEEASQPPEGEENAEPDPGKKLCAAYESLQTLGVPIVNMTPDQAAVVVAYGNYYKGQQFAEKYNRAAGFATLRDPAELVANHAASLQEYATWDGDQHHLLQKAYEHFFAQAGEEGDRIKSDDYAVHVDQNVHEMLDNKQNHKWAREFRDIYDRVNGLTAEERGKTLTDFNLDARLRVAGSKESQMVMAAIKGDSKNYEARFFKLLDDQLFDAGLLLSDLKDSLRPYANFWNDKGEKFTWKMYESVRRPRV